MKKQETNHTWILNGTLLTQNKNRQALNQHVLVENNRIIEIRKKTPSNRDLKTAKVVDAKNMVVLPGFIQTHVHLCQTLFKNQADELELLDWLKARIWPMEAGHTESTLWAAANIGLGELLSTGTTCILDMATVKHTPILLEAVEKSGMRASVGKCLMDHPEYTPTFLRENTAQALKEAQDLFSKWNGKKEDRIRISYAPRFAISCTEKLLRSVAEIALTQKATIHTHASENKKEIELVKKIHGKENIEFFSSLKLLSQNTVLAHCIWLSPQEIDLLLKSRTNVSHCPSSNLKLASGIAPVTEFVRKGINTSIGADGAPCNNNLNMFQEMRLSALLQKPTHGPKALCAQEALDMATLNGAKALGWEDDIGSIEIGKKADLISVQMQEIDNFINTDALKKENTESIVSALVYSSTAAHLRMTMVDGKILFQNGELKTLSKEKVIKEALKAQKYLLGLL